MSDGNWVAPGVAELLRIYGQPLYTELEYLRSEVKRLVAENERLLTQIQAQETILNDDDNLRWLLAWLRKRKENNIQGHAPEEKP